MFAVLGERRGGRVNCVGEEIDDYCVPHTEEIPFYEMEHFQVTIARDHSIEIGVLLQSGYVDALLEQAEDENRRGCEHNVVES